MSLLDETFSYRKKTSLSISQSNDVSSTQNIPLTNTKNSTWTLVFGFTVLQRPFVLSYLESLGSIVAMEEGEGNWMQVKWKTEYQATLALNSNGHVILEKCILGVLPGNQPTGHVVTRPSTKKPMDILVAPVRNGDLMSRGLTWLGF